VQKRKLGHARPGPAVLEKGKGKWFKATRYHVCEGQRKGPSRGRGIHMKDAFLGKRVAETGGHPRGKNAQRKGSPCDAAGENYLGTGTNA